MGLKSDGFQIRDTSEVAASSSQKLKKVIAVSNNLVEGDIMLVVDRREIEFDTDALTYYFSIVPDEALTLGLPAMPPTELRFDPKEGAIEVIYGEAEQARSFHIPQEALGAALVNYCIRTRIPLPRVADKIVRVTANCVVLTFKTWFDEPPVFEAREAELRAAATTKSWRLV